MSEPKDQSTIIIFFRISPKEELTHYNLFYKSKASKQLWANVQFNKKIHEL